MVSGSGDSLPSARIQRIPQPVARQIERQDKHEDREGGLHDQRATTFGSTWRPNTPIGEASPR
jgi:hypothetical protein